MATLMSALVAQARVKLLERTARYWADAEILADGLNGVADLYRAIADLHQEHFFTIDTTHVTFAASADALAGVPADVYRVLLIEPRDPVTYPQIRFTPKDYVSKEFQSARRCTARDLGSATDFVYQISQAGAPVGAPTIHVAPRVTTVLPLTLTYIPTLNLAAITLASANPIPGESDNAVIAWMVAYGLSQEVNGGRRSPDPEWLAIYGTEKKNVCTGLSPRQEQAPAVVQGVFEGSYDDDDWW